MANNSGTQLYDNAGMAEGGLLTANDGGTQLYDFMGLPEGFLGTSSSVTVYGSTMLLMGV